MVVPWVVRVRGVSRVGDRLWMGGPHSATDGPSTPQCAEDHRTDARAQTTQTDIGSRLSESLTNVRFRVSAAVCVTGPHLTLRFRD